MNTGSDFVKKLRPLGSALAIICFIGFLAVCFSSGKDTLLPGYSAPRDTAYYAQNLSELESELQENVLPNLDGIVSCSLGKEKVIITIEKEDFFTARSTLLKYFDEDLLDLRQTE
ncbi:MAG: hypothetical protein AB7D36_10590 [Oscillospiraceae bacterium]